VSETTASVLTGTGGTKRSARELSGIKNNRKAGSGEQHPRKTTIDPMERKVMFAKAGKGRSYGGCAKIPNERVHTDVQSK